MFRQIRLIGLAVLVLLSLSSVGMARKHYAGGALDAKDHGYEHGYRDGYQRGREDRSQGLVYRYQTGDYQEADHGYDTYMGESDDFRDGYRSGYRSGYDDGYNGRPGRWNDVYGIDQSADPYAGSQYEPQDDDVYLSRRWGYHDVAYDIGYRDGVQEGVKDRTHQKEFRPDKNDRYKDGDHGYHHEYGPKDAYKKEYRQAFIRGYEDGYGRWR